MVFSVDIWSHISRFLKYDFNNRWSLLWLCHNSRVGFLKCFDFWYRNFPALMDHFVKLKPQPKNEAFGSFCMYFFFEKKKLHLFYENSSTKRRIKHVEKKIKRFEQELTLAKEKAAKRERIIEGNNHFENNKMTKVAKKELLKLDYF